MFSFNFSFLALFTLKFHPPPDRTLSAPPYWFAQAARGPADSDGDADKGTDGGARSDATPATELAETPAAELAETPAEDGSSSSSSDNGSALDRLDIGAPTVAPWNR